MLQDFKNCPFCGKEADISNPDTLHPSGTYWMIGSDGIKSYMGHKDRQIGSKKCWVFNCPESSGGCGAEMHADSAKEAMEKWNRREVAMINQMKTYEVEVHNNGNIYWRVAGALHREDGPAIEYANGTKCWYIRGDLHREDGPAIEISTEEKYWYLNGKRYTEEEFDEKMNPVKELSVADLEKLLGYKIKIVKD